MTVVEIILTCDCCGAQFKGDGVKASDVRKEAKEYDWLYSGNKDYCPFCRPKRKDGGFHRSKKKNYI